MEKHEVIKSNERLLRHILSVTDASAWSETLQLTNDSISSFAAVNDWSQISDVIIVGHGTSYATSLNAEVFIAHIAGCRARALEAFRFVATPGDFILEPKSTLVIGVSCSGNTKTVVDALRIAKAAGARTMIVSNTGPIKAAEVSDFRIYTDAGVEKAANVQAYSISHLQILASLFFFSIFLGERKKTLTIDTAIGWRTHFDNMITSLGSIKNMSQEIEIIVSQLKKLGIEKYVVLGTGPNMGTMVEGALKICEFSWVFGAGVELEDFAHGRFREVGKNDLLIILSPSGVTSAKTLDLLTGCHISGTKSLVLTDDVTPALKNLATFTVKMPVMTNEYMTPFIYIIPLWLFGFYLRDEGELVGEKRHGLFAADINFEANFDEDGHKR